LSRLTAHFVDNGSQESGENTQRRYDAVVAAILPQLEALISGRSGSAADAGSRIGSNLPNFPHRLTAATARSFKDNLVRKVLQDDLRPMIESMRRGLRRIMSGAELATLKAGGWAELKRRLAGDRNIEPGEWRRVVKYSLQAPHSADVRLSFGPSAGGGASAEDAEESADEMAVSVGWADGALADQARETVRAEFVLFATAQCPRVAEKL
jgi:hypothetical protein